MTEIDALTDKYYLPVLIDQVYDGDVVLKKIRDGLKVVNGGKQFTVPIKVDGLTRGKYTADKSFPNLKKETMNSVDLPVRGHFAELLSDGFEDAINAGNAAIKNLIEEKMKDLEEAIRQELLEAFYRDPAAFDTGNEGFIGLQSIVDDNNTYAGLNRTLPEHAYWKSIVVENAATGVDITGDAGYQKLREFFMNVTGGGSEAKNLVFVGDYSTINKIEFMLAQRNQITTVTEQEANLGFTGFKLFGRPVHASAELEEEARISGKGKLYALNFDFLSMHVLSKNNFRMTKFKEDQKNDYLVKQLMVQGNFVCTKPKRQGVIRDIII